MNTSRLKELLRPCARHEAGHYIVAKVLGFKVDGISIQALNWNGDYAGSSEIILSDGLTNLKEVTDFLERRVQVLYAGAVSEALYDEEVNNDEAIMALEKGGAHDHAKIRELVRMVRSIKFPTTTSGDAMNVELGEIDKDLWNKTISHVEKENHLIRTLANELLAKVQKPNEKYSLIKAEIDDIPSVKNRFESR